MSKRPSYINFDHKSYRKLLASRYIIRGETGVLSYPYSKKIHPLWRFKTPAEAKSSARQIYSLFLKNLNSKITPAKRFIQADLCRKFLQMGYTRSMRYYYHKSGRKWGRVGNNWRLLPNDYDPIKKVSANIFKGYLLKALKNAKYVALKKWFVKKYH